MNHDFCAFEKPDIRFVKYRRSRRLKLKPRWEGCATRHSLAVVHQPHSCAVWTSVGVIGLLERLHEWQDGDGVGVVKHMIFHLDLWHFLHLSDALGDPFALHLIPVNQTRDAIDSCIHKKRVNQTDRFYPWVNLVLQLVRLVRINWFTISTAIRVMTHLGLARLAKKTISAKCMNVGRVTGRVGFVFSLIVSAVPT